MTPILRSPMLTRWFGLVLSTLLMATSSSHASTETPNEPQVIMVEGIRSPYKLSYAKMLLARKAFEEHSARAPDASFRFHAREVAPVTSPLVLDLQIGDQRLPLTLGAEGDFSLPEVSLPDPAGAFVVANRSAAKIKVRPRVRSPGVPVNAYRLGDLRVSCEAFWAMERDDVPALYRAAFAVAGGVCRSSSVSLGVQSSTPLKSATLKFGGQDTPVRLGPGGLSFYPPLHDAAISDDALVVVELSDQALQAEAPKVGGSQVTPPK